MYISAFGDEVNGLLKHVSSKLKDPNFEAYFKNRTCEYIKLLNTTDCDSFYKKIKMEFSNISGRRLLIVKNSQNRDDFNRLLPIILLAAFDNKRDVNPIIDVPRKSDNALDSLLLLPPSVKKNPIVFIPIFSTTTDDVFQDDAPQKYEMTTRTGTILK